MKRFGSAAWNGGLSEGKGSVSTESRALETYPPSERQRLREIKRRPRNARVRAGMRRLSGTT
jgi:hypothetical protein